MNRAQIERVVRDGLPEAIRVAVVELLSRAVDDDAGYLLVAGASLLTEPFAYPKPVIQLAAMHGPQPHPLEIVSWARRHGGSLCITKPHVPALNAIEIWNSCPAAITCRAEFRHAIRSLHVHMAMPDGRRLSEESATRALKAAAVVSTACLLNPEESER